MKAYDGKSAEGEIELIHGRIEHILDTSAKVAGLTNKQYKEWRRIECLEEKYKSGRSRSTSKRRKAKKKREAKKNTQEQTDHEMDAQKRDKQGAKDEEKRRLEKHEKEQRNSTRKKNSAI